MLLERNESVFFIRQFYIVLLYVFCFFLGLFEREFDVGEFICDFLFPVFVFFDLLVQFLILLFEMFQIGLQLDFLVLESFVDIVDAVELLFVLDQHGGLFVLGLGLFLLDGPQPLHSVRLFVVQETALVKNVVQVFDFLVQIINFLFVFIFSLFGNF